jgi:hypothetical protein
MYLFFQYERLNTIHTIINFDVILYLDTYIPLKSSFRIKSELIPTFKHFKNRHDEQIFLVFVVISQFPSK